MTTTKSLRELTTVVCLAATLFLLARPSHGQDTWETKTPMPDLSTAFAAGGVINDLWYVVGGNSEDGSTTAKVLLYDPSADTWTLKTPAGLSRAFMSAEVLNNKLYVVGGGLNSDSNTTTNALE